MRSRYNRSVFHLRDYQQGDFESLYKMDRECFDSGLAYSRSELQSYIQRKTSFSIVVEADLPDGAAGSEVASGAEKHPIAGFIVVEYFRRGYGHIITIDILPAYRRKNLGTLLMAAAEERVRKLGGFMMVLETPVNNLGAIAFYKRHKYNVLKTLPRYYEHKLDGLFLTKRL